MEHEQEALKELNMKCYVLSIVMLAVLAFRFGTAPEVHFALRHMDNPQAITNYARNASK